MKKSSRLFFFSFIFLVFTFSFISASFGYDNPTLPNIEEEQIITYRNITDTNSSDFWDNLNTPADILGSWINNDLGWINWAKVINGTLALNSSLSNYLLKTGDTMTGILYADASPVGIDILYSAVIGTHLTVDTDTLVVDAANHRVGIGTASPAYTLDVAGTLYTSGDIMGHADSKAYVSVVPQIQRMLGFSANVLFMADKRYNVTVTGATSATPNPLWFDEHFLPTGVYQNDSETPVVITIEGLPAISSTGVYIGWAVRYRYPKHFTVEAWNSINSEWDMIANYSDAIYAALSWVSDDLAARYTKIRYTFIEPNTADYYQISELFFINPEAAPRISGVTGNFLVGGNVGIGTTAPATKLEVIGGEARFKPSAASSVSRGYLAVTDTTSTNVGLQVRRWDNDAISRTLSLNPEGSNVGIGTTTPQNTLNVIGDGNFSGNLYGSLIYGEMWYHNHTATEINFAVDGLYYNLTFDSSLVNGITFNDTGDYLEIDYPGVYQVIWMASGDGQNNHAYYTDVTLNGAIQDKCEGHKKMTAGGDIVTMNGVCLLSLSVDDKIRLATADIGGTGTGNYYSSNINIVRIGN